MKLSAGRQTASRLLHREFQRYTLYRESDLITDEDRLVISTIHRAKGLEFDSVVIAGAHDQNFPCFFAKTPNAVIEEARILFVAMSRAKWRLVISAPQSVTTAWGDVRQTGTTRFLQHSKLRSNF